MSARSIAQGAWCRSLLAMVLMACAALGQTASDLGEGLRAELTGTPGVTAIKWWGKAGRTYFVQSSETLLPDSWQYMPVVEAGNEAVCTWNLQTSASKMFVRLVYTDQAFSGGAADADFDGDGLSNLLETAAIGPRSNPLAADTDGDGFSDSVEWGAGFNPVSGTSNPDASLFNGGVVLEFAVVDTWDHVQWRKQTSSPPVTYQTVADYGPGGDYDVSSWQETVPAVPSPRGLVAAESLNFGSWSTEPTTGEDLFFDQPLYAYRVEEHMSVVPGPEAPYKGGRNSGARYAQLRLVTNYPRMQPVTRLVKVLPEKWNAHYGEGFWQGTYAGPEAPQYYALQLPAGQSIGPPVTAQLEVQTGVARTATVAAELPEIALKVWNGQNAVFPVADKTGVGAFTVANKNDTDGDTIIDKDDNDVAGEIDLMKLQIAGYAGHQGKVKLTVSSGSIKLWEQNDKKTEMPLAGGAVLFDIPVGGINKVIWIEATAASTTLRDIEIAAGYQDAQGILHDNLDKIKATAVWAELTPNGMITTGNTLPNDLDDPIVQTTFANLHSSKFGIFDASPGKGQFSFSIGFEFVVKPAGIGNVPSVRFDVSRQREDFLWIQDNGGWFDRLGPPWGNGSAVFPSTPDLPTDDDGRGDEDNTPTNNHIYSIDNPATQFYPAPAARVVKRANFREFVRVKLNGNDFVNQLNLVEGSRCSPFQNWRMRGDVTKTNNVWGPSAGGLNELTSGHESLGSHP